MLNIILEIGYKLEVLKFRLESGPQKDTQIMLMIMQSRHRVHHSEKRVGTSYYGIGLRHLTIIPDACCNRHFQVDGSSATST